MYIGAATVENCTRFLKKVKLEPLHDPSILLLLLKKIKTLIQKGTHTPVFIAAVLTIAKMCKQPTCPSVSVRVRMWGIHTMDCYLDIKRNEILPCDNTDRP